jgi:hypothetical protein
MKEDHSSLRPSEEDNLSFCAEKTPGNFPSWNAGFHATMV